MDPLVLLPVIGRLRRHAVGRSVERVLPVGRTGLHVVFHDGPPGLRVDTRPAGGALLPLTSAPRRIRGGRSAWPDAAAVADRDLRDEPLSAVSLSPGLRCVRFVFGARGTLAWEAGSEPRVGVLLDGEPPRALPPGSAPPDADTRSLLDDLDAVASALEGWIEAAGRGAPEESLLGDLRALLPGLGEAAQSALLDAATRDRLSAEAWVAALRGEPLGVAGPAPARPCRLEPLEPGEAELGEALAGWYRAALEGEERTERRRRAAQLIKSERKRVARALGAVDRDEQKAGDPAELRRCADALLASGPAATPRPDGAGWRVPDPRQPESLLDVPADPPGASIHQTAERLYGKARRAERGVEARRERRASLERRRKALEGIRAQLEALGPADAPPDPTKPGGDGSEHDGRSGGTPDPFADGMDRVEEELERLGLAARAEHAPASASQPGARPAARRKGPQASPAARTFTSPGGFRVLVGRSARQNDVLTFKVAAPEDLWLHARERAGAHVVIRTAGAKAVPEADVRFAAGLAAAWSRAPEGERVEVHVARRKHVRKAKGAPAGQVTVRKSWTVTVVTPPAPSSDDARS